jgi:hypothetical protein
MKFQATEFYFESNVIIYSYKHSNSARKNNYLGFFKFYQPKATGGGFLIFEWTLHTKNTKKNAKNAIIVFAQTVLYFAQSHMLLFVICFSS